MAGLRKTRAIGRKLDCLNSSPQRRLERPSITAPLRRGHRDTPGGIRSAERSARWASGNDLDQGGERSAYVALATSGMRQRGITYGTRVLG
jgi:hypothetical protein